MLRQHQLGADAIGAGYQHRFLVAARRYRKQAAKSADASHDFRPLSSLDQRLDPLNKFVACINVDASVFVR